MLKGKILTLMLSGVLATNISSIATTFELISSETDTSQTTETSVSNDISVESSWDNAIDSTGSSTNGGSSVPKNSEENPDSVATLESSSLLETIEESQPDSSVIPEESETPAAEDATIGTLAITEVSTWAEFVAAVTDVNVTDILVTGDLIAEGLGTTITHQVNIDFNGFNLTMSRSFSIKTTETAVVTVSNLTFTGPVNANLFSGQGTITFTGTLQSLPDNLSGIVSAPAGKIIFDGLDLTYDSGTNTEAAIKAKDLSIINQSSIKSETNRFFSNSELASSGGAIIIDNDSVVTLNSNKENNSGQIFLLERPATFDVKGGSTLEMTGNVTHSGDLAGLIIVEGDGAVLNVTESSTVSVYSKNTTAVSMKSDGGVFNVDDHSTLHLQSDGQKATAAATLRFRTTGNMSFNASNHSKIEIIKTNDSGTTYNNSPAISMNGEGNKINVSGASDFIVKNEGDGTPTDPGNAMGNQAIYYQSAQSQKNEFNLLDEDSSVYVEAESGAAIDGRSGDLFITADKGTYFTARGQTASQNTGIFVAGTLTVDMNSLKYFDFRNDGMGYLFDVSKTIAFYNSSFKSDQSDLSVWSHTSNLDGEPTFRWEMVDYSLSGNDFETLDETNSSAMQEQFMTLTNYSRMSANNQTAQVDMLRTPTNADRYIYGHAIVPEAKGEYRDAFTDEVHVKAAVYNEVGEQVAEVEGNSIGDALSVYGDEEQMGLIKIEAPEERLLQANYSVKILEAWRGYSNGEWLYQSIPEDVYSEQLTVFDVTPPATATINSGSSTLSPAVKTVSGTGEVGANVRVALNGVMTDATSIVDAEGNYTIALPTGLQKEDIIHIFLQDHAGSAAVIKPPTTNSSVGNIQDSEVMAYHDTEFEPALKLTVVGVLELSEVPTLFDFGTQTVSNMTTMYRPNVTGNLIVSDTRGDEKNEWQLGLKEQVPLASTTNSLAGLFRYTNANETLTISDQKVIIEEGSHTEDGEINLSSQWNEEQGISLEIPVEKQILGNYNGTLEWSLEDVPANK